MRDIFLRPAEMFFSLRRRFARNSVATGAGYVTASQILRLVLLLISSSIVLRHFGPANYGVIAVAQAFFETTLNLQLQVGQAVQTFVPQLLAAGRPGAVRAVLWSGYLMRVIVFLLLGFLLTAVSPLLGGFYGDPQVGALLAILGVNAFTRTVAGPIDLNTMFALNRYRSVFIINCIDIAGALIAAIVTEVFDFSPAGYLWALLISMLPLYIYCWAQYSGIGHDLDWLRPDASDETAREWFVKLFRFGLPVSVSAFLYQASLNISILVVGQIFPADVTGLFGFAVNTARRGWGLISNIETVLLSFFAKAHALGKGALERATTVYGGMMFSLSMTAGIVSILFAREITLAMAGAQFLPAVPLLQLLCFQFLFRGYEYMRFATYADRAPRKMIMATILKILSEVGFIAALLPLSGLAGMTVAHVLSFAVCSAFIVWSAAPVISEPERKALLLFKQAKMALGGIMVLGGGMLLANFLIRLDPTISTLLRALAGTVAILGAAVFLRRAREQAATLS